MPIPERSAAQIQSGFATESISRMALQTRKLIVKSIACAGSGHIGGSLSCVEILNVLFFATMRRLASPKGWPYLDRFVLSKGHAEAAFYSVLSQAGLVDESELWTMRRFGSRLQAHPDPRWLPSIEFPSGSLGQGLSYGCGLAGAQQGKVFTYVLLGDGELQEGQVWEAAMFAGRQGLSRLVAVIDWNGFQLTGRAPSTPAIDDMAQIWSGLGWDTVVCDGHDCEALRHALLPHETKPKAVFARTVKGRGISFMENNNSFHGRALNAAEVAAALHELEENKN
jgi:transketolase